MSSSGFPMSTMTALKGEKKRKEASSGPTKPQTWWAQHLESRQTHSERF